uniref:Uncharacterized protein n=1 Tax=Anguilla anguilla TaxID=7936 RepID=A0A0E9XHQ6_ANGAN
MEHTEEAEGRARGEA